MALFIITAATVAWARQHYTFTVRFPLRLRFQSPLIIEPIVTDESAAEGDQQGRRLTPYQAYACRQFGSACRVALAIQRARILVEIARSITTTPTARSIGVTFRSTRST